MRYDEAKALRRTIRNPFLGLAIDRITERGLMWQVEFILTVQEYARNEPPIKCGACGAKAWRRASIGTFQCPTCNAFEVRGEWKVANPILW